MSEIIYNRPRGEQVWGAEEADPYSAPVQTQPQFTVPSTTPASSGPPPRGPTPAPAPPPAMIAPPPGWAAPTTPAPRGPAPPPTQSYGPMYGQDNVNLAASGMTQHMAQLLANLGGNQDAANTMINDYNVGGRFYNDQTSADLQRGNSGGIAEMLPQIRAQYEANGYIRNGVWQMKQDVNGQWVPIARGPVNAALPPPGAALGPVTHGSPVDPVQPQYMAAPPPTHSFTADQGLSNLLNLYHAGASDRMNLNQYGAYGADMLASVQKYDPNAHWADVDIGNGGEDPHSEPGKQLIFDHSLMPGDGHGNTFDDLRHVERGNDAGGPTQMVNGNDLYNGAAVWDSPYGPVTRQENNKPRKANGWELYAPMIISAIATAGAGGLLGAGIAGGTAGVTGGAAGLAAGNIAGGVGLSPSLVGAIPRGIGAVDGYLNHPAPRHRRPPPPPRAPVRPAAYNPTNYNNAGSAAKPTGNESSLVATQFSDDPYRYSE